MQESKLQSVEEELEHVSVKCTDAALFTEDFHKTLTSTVEDNPGLHTVEFCIFVLDTTLDKDKLKQIGIKERSSVYCLSLLFSVDYMFKKYKRANTTAKALEKMLFKQFKTLVTIH